MGAADVVPLEVEAGVTPFDPCVENRYSIAFWYEFCGPISLHAGDGGDVDAKVARASRP
jgi:hypothetical protein